ncbi:imelysin family protein [Marinibactrum halimedae]|uniref:Peptidase n=1 Tax=Marinibactrum halimedae TaxID=1444977 RepID=A0AA37WPL7_9GAMM|nr:imelysin family protein [Marinibactrum halimedae]MCD9457903.1 peptidase [Marinibactrum halimedae]GLS26272.1 peptidase [Marinibactrum halimedae]
MPRLMFSQTVLFTTLGFVCQNSLAVTEKEVVMSYADLAHVVYEDSLITAKTLHQQAKKLVEAPSAEHLEAAKDAWKAARVPYQQSEVFRFGNAVVDEWEGQLNAWPLDEGLIDYVDNSYQGELGNPGATANIIASQTLKIGAETINLQPLSGELLANLNELGGSEANVATGYHAIEFLLWGQDLNGTKAGAGSRPYTDFAKGEQCTHGNCDRRAEYLLATTELLVKDLTYMVEQWTPDATNNYRQTLLALPTKEAMTRMLFGMGSLALGELAGERMKVALEANSPEDEHDCFSDNTHYSHFYNAMGIKNVYLNEYQRIDGKLFNGDSLSELIANKNNSLDQQLQHAFTTSQAKLQRIVDKAEAAQSPEKFDQLIAGGNKPGAKMINDAIQALVNETALLEQVARTLKIENLNPDNADHNF